MNVKECILQLRREKRTDLLHVLDLIRTKELENVDIAKELVELFQQKKIVFAHETSYIQGNPSRWTDEEWKEAQKRENFRNSNLRSLYRQGFKKWELTLLRDVMQKISKMTDGRVQPEWGFFRVKMWEL